MMISKQRGISLPVVLLIAAIGLLAIRTGMALVPMYVDDAMLQQILQKIEQNGDVDGKTTNRDIRR